MEETARKILDIKKGVLAADESTHTIEKRFAALGIQSTPETHRKYRQMLFTAPGIEEYLSGIIMFDETVRQKADDGFLFSELLSQKGIVPGIKVDEGLEPFNATNEQVTKGLDGLSGRLKDYSKLGLKFTKWRAAILISDVFPSEGFLQEDMKRMAKFARISQEEGFIPFIEPEVLLDGEHTTTRCEEVETKVLKMLFDNLQKIAVDLKKVILKTSMVLPGKDSGVKAAPLEVAKATLRTLENSVPPEVPGIVFLSGGQTPDEAIANLNEINKQRNNLPWQLSFSFARALQEEAMAKWAGKEENVKSAQEIFIARCRSASMARQGQL